MAGSTVADGLFARATGVFAPDPDIAAACEAAEAHCEFDLGKLRPKLSGPIKVRFRSLPKDIAAQVDPRAGQVEVNADMRSRPPEYTAIRILAETAHLVDHYLLSQQQRKAIFKLFGGGAGDVWFNDDELPHSPKGQPHDAAPHGPHRHHKLGSSKGDDYFAQIGESFMGGFLLAWTDFSLPSDLTTAFKFPANPRIARGIRRVMGA